MADLKVLRERLSSLLRAYRRDIIYANEAASGLIDSVTYEVIKHGNGDQTRWLMSEIPELPEAIRREVESYARTPDEQIFVRNYHCSAPYPVPDDWERTPVSVRSVVDYTAEPTRITVFRDDGTHYEMTSHDPWPKLVFALRDYFGYRPENAG